MPPLPAIGAPAPDFRLASSEGREIAPSDYRGAKHVVLVFYPFDFSAVCRLQLPEYSSARARFEERDAVVLGVSRDSVYVHKAWARELGLEVPLLADMLGEAARAFGVDIPKRGINKRAVFVIDTEGVLRFAHAEDRTGDFTLHADEVLAKLDELQG